MKLFNWVHRKFRQNHTHDARAVSDESSRGSLAELQAHDWYARVKSGREDRYPSSMRLATAGFEPADPKSKKRGDACFQSIESVDVEQQDLAFLVKEIQHGLLAIGTLGGDNILAREEDLKYFETMYFRFDSDVSPTEVLELEVELEKVFYAQNEHDDIVDLHETKVLIQEEEDDKDGNDTRKEAKRHEGANERKLLSGKKVYPLQEFLETPIDPSLIKKKKLSRSLSNLFSSRKDCGFPIKRSDEKFEKGSENAKPILSSPSFLKALFKSKRAQDAETPHHKTKLDKLLRVFKKKHAFERSSDQQRSDGGLCGGVEEASGGRKEMLGGDDRCAEEEEEIMSDVLYLQEEDPLDEFETFRFEDWTDEYNQHPWWLRKDDLWMLKNENEYWIKTDEEYVVLEL